MFPFTQRDVACGVQHPRDADNDNVPTRIYGFLQPERGGRHDVSIALDLNSAGEIGW
jgi:hypothetical protein